MITIKQIAATAACTALIGGLALGLAGPAAAASPTTLAPVTGAHAQVARPQSSPTQIPIGLPIALWYIDPNPFIFIPQIFPPSAGNPFREGHE